MSYSAIGLVVPSSIERAKRIAKQLHRFYPKYRLSECQAVTAHLYGHADWFSLDSAVKRRLASAVCDEDLDDDGFSRRRLTQMTILCKELGNVDLEADYPAPRWEPPKSVTNPAHHVRPPGETEQRLCMALKRWEQLFASVALHELQPTAAVAGSPQEIQLRDFLAEWPKSELTTLPMRLGRWWSENIPHQPEVGKALGAFDLNVDLQTSLLRFARYWGTLCVHYARTINWTMCMGTAHLLAQRYADLGIWHDEQIFEASKDVDKTRMVNLIEDKQKEQIVLFFSVYPRDDFFNLYLAQPEAFSENMADVLSILNEPKSRRGTWSNS